MKPDTAATPAADRTRDALDLAPRFTEHDAVRLNRMFRGSTTQEMLEAVIRDIPEVLECLLITGQTADYQLKVVVRDMDDYQDLLLNRITQIKGVTGVHTSFVLRRVVDRTALPL